MAKTTTEEKKPTRADARVAALKRLMFTLDEMPISSTAKNIITAEWTKTYDRLNSLMVKHPSKKKWVEVWQEMRREDLFKEYDVVEKHFKYLSIFSQDFYSVLSNRWNDLLSTFNPNASWYQD